MSAKKLIFVYNADSGFMNTLLDIGHKIVSPATYDCKLCALTHTTFSMREEWREFVEQLGIAVEFLHRNELKSIYGGTAPPLPAILLAENGRVTFLLTRDDINRCNSLMELQRLISKALAEGK